MENNIGNIMAAFDEQIDEEIATTKAIKAMYAWFLCEDRGIGDFKARSELCNYVECLVSRIIEGNNKAYIGVPHLYLTGIERADEKNCEALVQEVFDSLKPKLTPAKAT